MRMMSTVLHNILSIFLTAVDASVTISLMVMSFSCRCFMARLTASLSILGDRSETSRLSTISMCTIVPESISRSVYMQYYISHLLLMTYSCYDTSQILSPKWNVD